jgi:hypothetical protein
LPGFPPGAVVGVSLALLMELSEIRRVRSVRLSHSIYQFAEAATKLTIKDVFDAVRTFTHYRMKLV